MPSAHRIEAEALGRWATGEGTWRWWLGAAGYFMGPFPSNAPFIAAGAGAFPARRLALAFGLSRAISDTFWVWTTGKVAADAIDLVKDAATDWRAVVMQVAGVVAVILVFRLPWSRWLGRG